MNKSLTNDADNSRHSIKDQLRDYEKPAARIARRDTGHRGESDFDTDSGYIYKLTSGMLVRQRTSKTVPKGFISATRESITAFTASSGQRMRRYLRSCSSEYANMVTLTYPFEYPSNGHAVKEHLRRFIQELRRDFVRRYTINSIDKFSVFWFLEFQSRGAPHFHLFTTSCFEKEFISKKWYEIVNSEDIRHFYAGTKIEKLQRGRSGTISYASKYAAKQEQKRVPEDYENVGRFWGVSGCRRVVEAATFVTLRQSRDEAILKITKAINVEIKAQISAGTATEIVRKVGESSVVLITSKQGYGRLLVLMSRLTAKTMRFDSMFIDCEVWP